MKKGKSHFQWAIAACSAAMVLALAPNTWAQQKPADSRQTYYTPATTPLFNPYPNVTDKKPWLVKNLGPVGIGINLIRPGMTMQVNNVERAPASFTYSVGTGQVHASGVNCMSFLLMAKLCGVEVDKYMFDETFSQFYRFAGHGNVAYGTNLPEGGFRDNGKTSSLAFGLGAAAMIDPDGERSVYAHARDNSATKAFYATNWFHAAHTGGGMAA